MTEVRECMTKDCQWIQPDTPIIEAAKLMVEGDFGFLPVGDGEQLLGMVTDRDTCVRAVAYGRDLQTTAARDIMSDETYYCYDDQDTEDVCDNMAELQIRRMPVVDKQKRLVGVISLGDLSKSTDHKSIGNAEEDITMPNAKAA